jgi:ankyrin repeat protein/CRP-like cAMP-binding protein
MLLNIAIAAWIIGSITLLVLKGDETSREYRDSLSVLHLYGTMHNFEKTLMDRLKRQLRLDFNNREIADEQVLKHFPSQVRRKIMRRLYHGHLINSKIMTGIRPQFVDAFLTSCKVEIFSPGEEIVERGSIVSDLYLLVGGIAEVAATHNCSSFSEDFDHGEHTEPHPHISRLEAGNFIGEIGFFTESPQLFSVISVTVCKTLTLSRQSYQILAEDHPGSSGKILHNLLQKVESAAIEADLPKPLHVLRSGSAFENDQSMHHPEEHDSLTAVKDLVKMHMRRRQDDDTTKLLFAASRGDTKTISLMLGHGFDPNNKDYDCRTALMVASMKGNADAVKLLLKFNARPNEIDMNGSSALMEATKYGHKQVMELLLKAGGELCMPESQAASVLCQAVFDCDIMLLKRLVKAGINVNAADYDKRTASHIAAAEGNTVAIRVLVEGGADLTLPDRWGNSVGYEAKRSRSSQQLLELLEGGNVDTDK